MGNFVKGAVFGAAVAMIGHYLLNTEEGKATCQKVKTKVKDAVDDFKSDLDEALKGFTEKDSTTEVSTEVNTDGAE